MPEPPGEEPARQEEGAAEETPPVSGPIPQVRKETRLRGVAIPIVMVVLLGVAVFMALQIFFRIDTIEVEGNGSFTAEQIVQASGLSVGQNVFEVNEARIKENIENYSWLLYVVRVEVGEHSVTIQVHERTPVAYTHCRAIWYTLDSQGMALKKYALSDELSDLILVDGLLLDHCDEGQRILSNNSERLDIYVQLML